MSGREQVEQLRREVAALRAELAEQTSQRDQAQQVLDIAGVMILKLDKEGTVTQVNQRGCEILGWTMEEALGQDWFATFLPKAHREETREVFAKLMAGELEPLEFHENPVLTRSGFERTIAWHNALLRDEEGRIIGTLSSGEDITGRRAAEKARSQAEELYRTTIDSLDTTVHLVDGNLRVVLFNRRFKEWCKELGLDTEGEGRPLLELFPFLPPEVQEEYRQVFATGEPCTTLEEVEINGQHLHTRTTKLPVSIGDRVLSVLTTVTDMTGQHRAAQEREQLQKQLVEVQKLESVGRLAGGVAHDFNNLLTAISGFADMVQDGLDPQDPLKEDVEQIQKAAASASELTAQLLAFSRKQIISPRVVNLNREVARSERMLRRLIGEDIDLSFRPEGTLEKVLLDPGQLDQILINLAVNARDAMPTGGKLTIETKTRRLDGEECDTCGEAVEGEYVSLEVIDDGPGMDAALRSKIFEPFFTTKEQGKGTGLGLATVHGIVHQHGGHLSVRTAPGQGTTIVIYLPSVRSGLTPVQLEAPVVDAKGEEVILVVEDQGVVRRLATRVLKGAGYKVHEARDGAEALARMEEIQGRLDLLLTDVVMPRMSGTQLYEQLQQTKPGLRALFMSGYPDDTVANHGVVVEGINLLQKPFLPHELVRRIRETLDS